MGAGRGHPFGLDHHPSLCSRRMLIVATAIVSLITAIAFILNGAKLLRLTSPADTKRPMASPRTQSCSRPQKKACSSRCLPPSCAASHAATAPSRSTAAVMKAMTTATRRAFSAASLAVSLACTSAE